jgi:hypothetical protein
MKISSKSFKCTYTTVYNGGTESVVFENYLREWNIKMNGTGGDLVCWEFGEFLCLR